MNDFIEKASSSSGVVVNKGSRWVFTRGEGVEAGEFQVKRLFKVSTGIMVEPDRQIFGAKAIGINYFDRADIKELK